MWNAPAGFILDKSLWKAHCLLVMNNYEAFFPLEKHFYCFIGTLSVCEQTLSACEKRCLITKHFFTLERHSVCLFGTLSACNALCLHVRHFVCFWDTLSACVYLWGHLTAYIALCLLVRHFTCFWDTLSACNAQCLLMRPSDCLYCTLSTYIALCLLVRHFVCL